MINQLFAFVTHLRTLVLLLIYAPVNRLHASTLNNALRLPSSGEPQELDVNIDFDEASFQWRRNKRAMGNGEFAYIHTNSPTTMLPYTPPQHSYFLRSRKKKRTDMATPITDDLSPTQEDSLPVPTKRRKYNLRSSSQKV